MKICIIGAGAMGSLFGALLHEAGHKVGLVAARNVYFQAIQRNNGVILEQAGTRRVVPCQLSLNHMDFADSDLCIVFVKATATEAVALAAAQCLSPHGYALTLQNGLGNAETLAQHISPERILAGNTSQAALLLEPGVVCHTGSGTTSLGPWGDSDHATAEAEKVAQAFNVAGINTETLTDVRASIWDKLFVNIGINAIGALVGITNGQVGEHPDSCRLAALAMAEAKAVAMHLGIKTRDDLYSHFLHICKITAQNRCSMWQDMQLKRLTEVDFIHGTVNRLGTEHHIPTPVNDVLASLVRTAQYYNLQGDKL